MDYIVACFPHAVTIEAIETSKDMQHYNCALEYECLLLFAG
jgi:hypothetical protein